MDGESIFGHIATGIYVSVKTPAGGNMVNQLDTGDFDDPMTVARIETGRFGI
jgi:hypothetical protein